jgi:hypothetical protein
MTERAQTARANGAKSRGPKSSTGLAKSSKNALRHGLRAEAIVLPGESVEAWEAHRAAIVADLRPTTYLAELLVERVALQTWRLQRAARVEQAVAAIDMENGIHEDRAAADALGEKHRYGVTRDVFEQAAEEAETLAASLVELRDGFDGEPLADEDYFDRDAYAIVCESVNVDRGAVGQFPETAGGMRAFVLRVAEIHSARLGEPITFEYVLGSAILSASRLAEGQRGLLAEFDASTQRRRTAVAIGERTDLLLRYEGTVERSLLRTLAALREEQAAAPIEGELVEPKPAPMLQNEAIPSPRTRLRAV